MTDDTKPPGRDHLNDMLVEWAPHINLHLNKLQNENRIPPHVDPTDLQSAGMHGLIEAFKNYDPKVGANFATYAGTRIRGKMLDHITSSGDANAVDYFHYKKAKQFMKQEAAKKQAAQQAETPPKLPTSEEE